MYNMVERLKRGDPMSQSKIFNGMDELDKQRIFECFSVTTRRYLAGEQILTYSDKLNNVCVVLSGSARVYAIDAEGNCSLIEYLQKNDVFGEVFHFPFRGLEYIAEADENCEIMFIGYDHIIHPCSKACLHHSRIINNLFALTAEKMQTLELRINILAQKNVRRKLLAYLEYAGHSVKGEKFSIGMTITELAAYLNVDRSSLMREMKRMKDEGIIWSEGRWFRLLQSQ